MKVIETPLNDVFIIEPKIFGDDRGFFFESFNLKQFSKLTGVNDNFVQDNHSKSQQSVLRGLHYQTQQTQGKLVRVIEGEIYDVVIDLRQKSSTFGQIFGLLLNAGKHQQFWVPKGFAHGFIVTSHEAQVLYKTTDYYAPEYEQSILWNDKDLNIPWPLNGNKPLLSQKDKEGHSFQDAHYF